jgi:luciferase family oxidoreductase group 1
VPAEGNAPEVWLLGSSGFSAQLAGLLGLPFAFAHHFSGENTLPALELYRASFRPGVLASPYAMVCASVLVADSPDEARRLALPGALSFVRLRQGLPGVFPSVKEAEAHPWTARERAAAEYRMDGQVIGSPAEVHEQLSRLATDTSADELMVMTVAHAPADRLRSYELLASLGAVVDGELRFNPTVAAADR